jgi:hypothetical protein
MKKFYILFAMKLIARIGLALLTLMLLRNTLFAGDMVYHYYPEKTELTGTLTKKMFYGPPGYGEDPRHDKKEHVFILKLDRPINVVAESSNDTSHDNVREIQVNNLKGSKLDPMLKRKVKITGKLSSASIGHDHTDVLIDAEEIIPDGAFDSTAGNSPEDVISQLYRDFSRNESGSVHMQRRELLSKFFDSGLVNLFIKDQECQKREKGICNIDFMIQYGAQDDDISEFRVGAFNSTKNSVEVTFKNFGKRQVLVYKMGKTPAGWKISDIKYRSGPSLAEILRSD